MRARLGEVLYWACTGIALLLALGAAFGLVFGHGGGRYFAIAVFAGAALLSWLIGRVCRYVLAGR